MTYAQSGVDIERGDRSVQAIKTMVASTKRPGVKSGLGGFSAVFDPKLKPGELLLSTTDGVATKLMIAQQMGMHDTVGIDLVAMCVNDLTAQNAEPLFFLDYIAGGRLDTTLVAQLIKGMTEGCKQAGCALVGGEMAEMPGLYSPEHYDLAGFAVGKVHQKELVDGRRIRPGQVLVGLAASGHHSNGFSLTRAILKKHRLKLSQHNVDLGCTWGEALLTPTAIYHPARAAWQGLGVTGLSHITGGGLPGNLSRILPKGAGIEIFTHTWAPSLIYPLLQKLGNVSQSEMFRTYNMGVGLVAVLPAKHAPTLLNRLKRKKITAFEMGRVVAGKGVKLLRGQAP